MFRLFRKSVNKYNGWIIAIDLEDSIPKYRFCWIRKAKKDGAIVVDIPSLNLRKVIIRFKEDFNNYFFESQFELVDKIDKSEIRDRLKSNLTEPQ